MDDWNVTHLCTGYNKPDCGYFLQTDNKETFLNGKRLDVCCYYCTSENKVRKIGSGGTWTGLSPKFCPKRRAAENNEMSVNTDGKTEENTMSKFDISTMLAAPTAVMPEQYSQAAQLHAEIINCAKTAQENLYQMAIGFKKMRDEKLYQALGYDNFGDYCEKEAEMSRRSVYNYIKVIEKLPEEFVQRLHKFETKKLLMLTDVSEEQRSEIIDNVDIENTTVKKLKEKIKELEGKNSAADKASAESKRQLAQREEEINKLKGENIKLRNSDEKSASKLAAEAAKAEKLKTEKERLEQQLKEAEKRAAERSETAENSEDKKKIADLEMQVKELEKRDIQVVFEKDEEEINRLKEEISRLEKSLEEVKNTDETETDVKVFAVRLTIGNYEKLIDIIKESGNAELKNAVMNAQILRV